MDAIIQRLAQELERPVHQVENVVHLIDEGNTIPCLLYTSDAADEL